MKTNEVLIGRFWRVCSVLMMGTASFCSAFAQEEAKIPTTVKTLADVAAEKGLVPSFVRIDHLRGDELLMVLRLVSAFKVQAEAISEDRIILVGAEDAVAQARKIIEELDVPPPPVKNIELLVYLVFAARDEYVVGDLTPCPDVLSAVTQQLQSTFGYSRIGLVDTLAMRVRDGSGADTSGLVALPTADTENPGNLFQLGVSNVRVASGDRNQVSLDEFSFQCSDVSTRKEEGGGVQRHHVGVKADIDVLEYQMAVVGHAKINPGKATLFVVVSARVIEE